MKVIIYFIVSSLLCAFTIMAHQPEERFSESILETKQEQGGQPLVLANEHVFYDSFKPEQIKAVSLNFEKRSDNSDSDVLMINGNHEFYEGVIQHSKKKPVVVKICAPRSKDSNAMKEVFQDAAQKMKEKSTFVSMDLFARNGEAAENYQIVIKLMMFVGVQRLTLPTLLFFKDGRLIKPEPVVQGLLSAEKLAEVIATRLL